MAVETNLGRALTEALRTRNSEETAVVPAADGTSQSLTALQMQDRIIRLALGLSHEGLKGGDRVLLAGGLSLDMLVVQTAVWALGAVTIHLDDGLSGDHMAEALGRVKAQWMAVDDRQTLGALELMDGHAVSQATLVMRRAEDAERQASRVLSLPTLLELGRKRRLYDLNELAQSMFQVPSEARAAILYWPSDEGLGAAALSHRDLLDAQVPLPAAWGIKVGDHVLMTTSPGSRDGLIAVLRLLAHRTVLVFPEPERPLHVWMKTTRPHGVVGRAPDLRRVWERLHEEHDGQRSVRRLVKRGLNWLGRRIEPGTPSEEETDQPPPTLEQRIEQGTFLGKETDFGDRLRWVWCSDGELEPPLQTLFAQA
ncbi:MAG: AMP-binding protein, partial [Myxococcota bacterium]